MAKKKSKSQAFVLKPWCWYCEREFEDEKVLLQHQKSKHFKCQMCPRKLNTAGGLMVHSQQVHKCDPEPLTNTLPGRDGYDIEIFGMEGVPTNALAEWKARKESEAGVAALSSAAAKNRPRNTYNVIPEADLHVALIQHKALMAARDQQPGGPRGMPPPMPGFPPNGMPPPPFPGFPPPGMGMPPPTLPPGGPPPGFQPPPGFRPPFPFPPPPGTSPLPPPGSASPATPLPPPSFVPQSGFPPQPPQPQFGTPTPAPPAAVNGTSTAAVVPKDGVLWPDSDTTPAEKRAQDPRYRYTSPGLDGDDGSNTKKRKAAEDFL